MIPFSLIGGSLHKPTSPHRIDIYSALLALVAVLVANNRFPMILSVLVQSPGCSC